MKKHQKAPLIVKGAFWHKKNMRPTTHALKKRNL